MLINNIFTVLIFFLKTKSILILKINYINILHYNTVEMVINMPNMQKTNPFLVFIQFDTNIDYFGHEKNKHDSQ